MKYILYISEFDLKKIKLHIRYHKITHYALRIKHYFFTFASAFERFSLRVSSRHTGKSRTASSLRILQDGNVAKVVGCSGAIRVACPPASLAQLARAREL